MQKMGVKIFSRSLRSRNLCPTLKTVAPPMQTIVLSDYSLFIYVHAYSSLCWNAALSGPLPNADNFFLISDFHLGNVFQVDATTGVTGQLLPIGVTRYPWSLAYYPTAKLIYWSDVTRTTRTINRYSLVSNINTVIYRDPHRAGKYT